MLIYVTTLQIWFKLLVADANLATGAPVALNSRAVFGTMTASSPNKRISDAAILLL
jgi:hypothetical protein